MRRRSVSLAMAILLAASLAGCATTYGHPAVAGRASDQPTASTTPEQTPATDAAARERAQKWLDEAALPPGAVRSEDNVAAFTSFTGWPCGPYVQLEGFWRIPGATVGGTANWLRLHPTANLITTAVGPIPDDPAYDSAIVGYIPAVGAQEGIVYTIQKVSDGVGVRAEVAAATSTATCAPPPGGGSWGAPGQG